MEPLVVLTIDHQVRIHGWQTRLCIKRISAPCLAHVVAVQVDPGGILAGTGTQGAILAAEMFDLQLAVLRIDAVIAVGVEQGRHQQGEAVQKRAMTPAEQIAHQHQGRLFSLHFAGVNAALNQHHGQARTHRILGCEAAMIGENQERQKAPFRGAAEIRDAQPRIAPDAQRLDERQHVGMGGGLTVARCSRRASAGPGQEAPTSWSPAHK